MQVSDKIKVGIVPCLADLYNRLFSPEKIEELRVFAESIPDAIGSDIVDIEISRISSTQEQISVSIEELRLKGVEMIVVMLAPYCPSGDVVPALLGTDIPVLLWPVQTMYELIPQEITNAHILLSHGVHAVQDIANILRKNCGKFGILHGHYLEDRFLDEFEQWAKAARIYGHFVDSNPLQIGGHFENMLDLQISDAKFISDCGIKMTSCDQSQLAAELASVDDVKIKSLVEQYKEYFAISTDVSDEMLKSTARGELAVCSMMNKIGSKACGINFQTLCNDQRIGDPMHVAASRLMADGMGYAGEGDWVTAAFVYAMQSAVGMASFSEIFSVDYQIGRVLLKHWGEGNVKMARTKAKMIKSAFNDQEKAVFCIVDMEFSPGEATLVNLNASPEGNSQLISIYGDITDDLMPNSTGPRALFKPRSSDIHRTLDEYAYNGGSHHLVLVNGNFEKILAKLAKLTGWNYMSL